MIQQIPLAAVPSQTLGVVLGGQRGQLAVFQRGVNLYLTLIIDGSTIVTTRICRNRTWLTLSARYQPFTGDMIFVDMQGNSDPTYLGLADRFLLFFVPVGDMPA